MTPRHASRYLTLLTFAALPALSSAGSVENTPGPAATPPTNWLTGEEVTIGGIFSPHFHFNSTYGGTSSSLGHELGAGHHDPVEDGWTVQGIELGLSARLNEHIEAFGAWHGYWENESPHDFDSKFEEYFLKFKDLPGGFDIRAGQYLNRFGIHNAMHMHAWDWVDNYLVSGRFLGDDGQYSAGAEVKWSLPVSWISSLSVSVGDAQLEAHEHEKEPAGEEESLYEAAGAMFAGTLVTAQWANSWNLNDFHQFRGGLSGAWGDNVWGRQSQVAGVHIEYQWRENGLERGGDYFRWRTEVMQRNIHAVSGHLPGEEDHGEDSEQEPSMNGSFHEWGLYSSASYGKSLPRGVLEGSLRYEYVEGVDHAGLPQRHRISPAVTFYLNSLRTAFVRGQANFDDISGSGSENSVWFSFGLNWGGAEVR